MTAAVAPPAPAGQIPNPPGAASLSQGATGTLVVTWTAPAIDSTHDAATGFNLWSSPSGVAAWTTVSGVTSPYILSGLASGAAFDVQVESSNPAGTSAWSPITTLSTAIAMPYAPGAASLTQGAGSNLTVVWNAPATDGTHNAATAFALQWSPSGAGNWTTVSSVTSPYTLTGLASGAPIDVQLQSSNAAGPSAWSATSTLTTAAATSVLYAPNVSAAATLAHGSGSNLTVTWNPPTIDSTHSAATSFALRSSPSGAANWTTVTAVTSPYILTGLTAGAAIDVQIQGENTSGASAWSATSTLTTALFAPNAPSAATLAQGTGSNLTVTWAAPAIDSMHSAATSFALRSSPSGANTWTNVTAATSPYTLSGLTAGAAIDVQIQSANVTGISAWSATSTLMTASGGPLVPNAPTIASVAGAPDGTTSKLIVTWSAPAVDATHNSATAYNLRSSPTGANTWTTVSGVTSPYTLTGLNGATSIDVEVQGVNAAATPGAWSAITTGTTWGASVTQGGWTAAATQVHNTSVGPNGGVQLFAVAAPTAVTAAAFAWSASNTVIPTSGLIAALADGQSNGWGQWFNAPATAGTFYLWLIAQGAGSVTTGALVTAAITVT